MLTARQRRAVELAIVLLGGGATTLRAADNSGCNLFGTVRTVTGRPLAAATVRVDASSLTAVTDPAGKFRIAAPPGARALTITHAAFVPLSVQGVCGSQDLVLTPWHRLSEDIVVRAVRADAQTPVTKLDLDSAELARLNFGQEMPVLLKETPSATSYSDAGAGAGYAYLSLRGIQQTRVNMTLDGVPLNEPEDSAVYFTDFGDFASSLSSIQIQRGVGASTVGAASFGGSVNFASVDLAERRQVDGTLGAGSFGTRRGSLAYQSGRFGPGLALYGRGTLQQTDGFREHSGVEQQSTFFALSRQGEASFLKVFGFVGREQTQLAFLASEQSVIESNLRDNPLSPDERDDFGESFIQAKYTHALGAASSLSLQAYSVGASGWYRLAQTAESGLWQYGLDWRFSGGSASLHHARGATGLTVGVHGYDYASRHTRDVVDGGRDYLNRGHKNEANAFAKLTRDMGRVHAYADAQVRWARFRFEGAQPLGAVDWAFFNPKVGARCDVAHGVALYGSLGRTTREPARSDMLAGEDNPTLPYDLRAVEPERVTDLELGAELRRSRMTVSANVYAMEFRHEIALTGELSEIGLPLRRNVDRSRRRGLEVHATYQPHTALRLTGTAAVSDNRIATWTQFYDLYDPAGTWVGSTSRAHRAVAPLLTPAAIASTAADWQPRPWLRAGLAGRWVATSYLDNTGDAAFATPSAFTLDASARLDLSRWARRGKPALRAQVTNVLNNRHAYPSGYSYRYFTERAGGLEAGGQSYYYPLATRSLLVMLDLSL
jgi:iron complex outermembrane recepter protein